MANMDYGSKVMFIGDVHLRAQNPASRKDDYVSSLLEKLDWALSYAKDAGIRDVVFLGDVFDAPTIAWAVFPKVLGLLKHYADLGVRCSSIVGNHDIRYDRLSTLDETSLGVLFMSGYLGRLAYSPIRLKRGDSVVDVIGFDFGQEIASKSELLEGEDVTFGVETICVAHEYFNYGLSDKTLTDSDLDAYKYDHYVFGHDHSPYNTYTGNGWLLHRPGSLARNSADAHNRLRIPRVLVYDVILGWSFVDVAVAMPSEDVLMYSPEKEQMSMYDLVESLRSTYEGSTTSVREYVSGLSLPADVGELVYRYLDILGV